jgi:hypothetical protein
MRNLGCLRFGGCRYPDCAKLTSIELNSVVPSKRPDRIVGPTAKSQLVFRTLAEANESESGTAYCQV